MDRLIKRLFQSRAKKAYAITAVKLMSILIFLVVTSAAMAVPKDLENSLPLDLQEIQPNSIEIVKQAAARGESKAQYMLGTLYAVGRVVGQDYPLASHWLAKSASQDFPDALFELGILHFNGLGTPNNPGKAHQLWSRAAQLGHMFAQARLADLYAFGQRDTESYKKAFTLYTAAAKQGYAPAQYNLGVMYQKGRGVTPNMQQAVKWWRRAAESNYPYAQLNLGVLYDEGSGVKKDHQTAIRYYQSAAQQGDLRAVYRLGKLHESCDEPEPDLEKAYMWFTVAAQNGVKDASQHLRQITPKLSSDKISKARHAADNWLKRYRANQ